MQEGQILLVAAEIGFEEQARATAEAAYKRGAKFVDLLLVVILVAVFAFPWWW